jgi:serine/threonine-protein kinase HipA
MTECRLLEESGRAHFITRRYDRSQSKKIHKTSLCSIAHMDFNNNLSNSYEQAFNVARQLKLQEKELEQLVRLMAFNVIYRNQDDHTKNIEFLMSQEGVWMLAPVFDLTFSYNPDGQWTSQH